MEKHPQPAMGTEGDVVGKRILALILDGVILGVFFVVVFFLFGAVIGGALLGGGSPGPGAGAAFAGGIVLLQLLSFVVFIGYYVYMEGAYGQTLGKKALGLVVVDEDGTECSMGGSAIRNVLRLVDGLFAYLVGLVVILLTDQSQRIGDLAASTVVVETA